MYDISSILDRDSGGEGSRRDISDRYVRLSFAGGSMGIMRATTTSTATTTTTSFHPCIRYTLRGRMTRPFDHFAAVTSKANEARRSLITLRLRVKGQEKGPSRA